MYWIFAMSFQHKLRPLRDVSHQRLMILSLVYAKSLIEKSGKDLSSRENEHFSTSILHANVFALLTNLMF